MVDEQRISRLEDKLHVLELKDAVKDERDQSIIRRLDKIDSHVAKLVWLMLGGVGAGFLNFLLQQGFFGG